MRRDQNQLVLNESTFRFIVIKSVSFLNIWSSFVSAELRRHSSLIYDHDATRGECSASWTGPKNHHSVLPSSSVDGPEVNICWSVRFARPLWRRADDETNISASNWNADNKIYDSWGSFPAHLLRIWTPCRPSFVVPQLIHNLGEFRSPPSTWGMLHWPGLHKKGEKKSYRTTCGTYLTFAD